MDLMGALQIVLKKSLAEDGLHRGLREAAKAIESRKALLCVLAQDCDQADYTKLIQALCNESERSLVRSAIRGVSRRVGGLVQARRRRPSEKGCEVLVRCRLRLRGGNAGAWRLARILEDCLIVFPFRER